MTSRPHVLVTGGSRGIGAALCRLAATHGWNATVNYAAAREAAIGKSPASSLCLRSRTADDGAAA